MDRTAQTLESLQWDNNTILDVFPSGVVVCDESGQIVFCNQELSDMFGYRREELIGQGVEALLPVTLKEAHLQHRQDYMQSAEKKAMGSDRKLYAQHKDGSTFPVEVGLNPVDGPAGKRIIASVVDITQRVRIENNFKSVVDAAPVGMLIVDAGGTISHCNQQLLDIFGYTQDELLNQPMEVLIPERHHMQHITFRDNYLSRPTTRGMGGERNLTGLHKSGSEIPVEIGLNPIETEDGLSVIAAVIDITERKKAELKLKQMNADLDEFTYVASHDLKSPLRGINSLIEWIEEDLGEDIDEGVKNNLGRVHVRISRMEKLIEDLLAYARSGKTSGSITTVHLDKLLSGVIDLCNVPDGFDIKIEGYQGTIQTSITPLETVLRNLLSNAIKHHDKTEGEITIKIELGDGYCTFEVSDDGPGIPQAAHERVFKLFQALNSGDGRSGVGLAVCKRLVEACDGIIELESTEGERGSCFRFSWPSVARRDINE